MWMTLVFFFSPSTDGLTDNIRVTMQSTSFNILDAANSTMIIATILIDEQKTLWTT